MKHTAQEIYKAIEESIFEEKYGIPLKLALAAPELLEALKGILNNVDVFSSALEGHHGIDLEQKTKEAKEAIKKATSTS